MKIKILIITLLMIIFLSIPTFAEEIGMHGEVGFTYELESYFPGQTWYMDIYYNFNNWLSIGTNEITYTNGFNCNTYGFIPTNQLYELYLKINFNDKSFLKICQWCNHTIYSCLDIEQDCKVGLYLEGNYKF